MDWLVVGLGNPGREYDGTPHNVGFEIARLLARRWDLPRPRERFRGLLSEGRAGIGGPRVAVLLPQTYMNDAGRSVGPARGSYKLPLDRLLVLHDEIDLPFGEVRVGLGGTGFWRVRAGVGRPSSTDPDIVAGYVLGRFRQSPAEVQDLVSLAADEAERLVLSPPDAPSPPA